MIIRRSVLVAVSLGAALTLIVSGCSDRKSTDSAGQSAGNSDKPSVTTVNLTLNDQPVDLTGAALKCYDYEGHLMVEAHNAPDPDASHFLMDYYQNKVALSIGVRGGDPDLFEYEQGKSGQTAKVTRDGDSVSVTGTIGVALSDSTAPQPFSITASCAKFFNTPPDSSKVDSSGLPSIPASCPPGQAVCLPGSK
ncbi:MAG TPA: lipoprotein LpqH [Kribbella sp.]|jgi:hypothetical protein